MALTEQEEAAARLMLTAYQNAKQVKDLPWAKGSLSDMHVPVIDDSGETRRVILADAITTAGNPIAGRYWNEQNATPTAAGYYGSLEALKSLPQRLGLGRYLVTDDRKRRKLDVFDSTRYDDASPAKLDGSEGQCMWCWNAHYYSTWKEGGNTVEVISFLPIPGKVCYYVPAGGISWFNAGVMDWMEQKLCSVISSATRYRGGQGSALANTQAPADAPQATMLGMPVTGQLFTEYSTRARARGEGWEANWYIARAAIGYMTRIILGTRDIQQAYNASLDANGLRQGGLGAGVTELGASWLDWYNYNSLSPLVPTSVGLEARDDIPVIVPYSVMNADGTTRYVAPVPVFFGLVNPFGHLLTVVGGQLLNTTTGGAALYSANSMYAMFDWTSTSGKNSLGGMTIGAGVVKKLLMAYLRDFPSEITGDSSGPYSTYYADYYKLVSNQGFFVRLAGGFATAGAAAGMLYSDFSCSPDETSSNLSKMGTSPLCYFEEDPTPDYIQVT